MQLIMQRSRWFTIALKEFQLILQQPLYWIMVAVLGLFTFSLSPAVFVPASQSGASDVQIYTNSWYSLAQFFAFSGLLGFSLPAGIIAGMSVPRDFESNLNPILHSTPLSAHSYVWGKFAGIFSALLLALFIQVGIIIIHYELLAASESNLINGPFSISKYFFSAILFSGPGIVFFAGLGYATGIITPKPLFVYMIPAMLFIFTLSYALTPAATPQEFSTLDSLTDPSGLYWMLHKWFSLDRGMDFYNLSPLEISPLFAINRLLMLLMPLLLVAGATFLFSRRLLRGHSRTQFIIDKVASKIRSSFTRFFQRPKRVTHSISSLATLQMDNTKPGYLAGLYHMLRGELTSVIRQPMYYLFGAFIIGMVIETATESSTSILNTSTYLTAGTMAVSTFETLSMLVCLVLLFFTVEMLNRNTVTGFAPLLYTTPIRSSMICLSQLLTAGVLAGFFLFATTVSALSLLQSQGPSFAQTGPFILVWGGLLSTTLIFWISFIMLVSTFTKNRVATYAIGLLSLALSMYAHARGQMTWVTNWDLWGVLRWTDMGPFSLNGSALLYNRLLMLSVALLMFVISVLRFNRTETDNKKPARFTRHRHSLYRASTLAVLATIPLLLGSYIHIQITQGFQGSQALAADKLYRQQNWNTWYDFQPASIVDLDVDLEILPDQRQAIIKGHFMMVNQTSLPMSALPFSLGQSAESPAWQLNDVDIEAQNRAGLYILPLTDTLAPGDSIQVEFNYAMTYPQGFTRNGGGMQHFILPAGTLLSTARGEFLPLPGLDTHRGADNSFYLVNATEELAHLDERNVSRLQQSFTSKIQITAPDNYITTATGSRTNLTYSESKTTSVWETQYPVQVFNVMAGKWEEHRQDNNAIYYHPSHTYNIDEIFSTLQIARKQYSSWFSPYPWTDLKIGEFPNLETNATAFPTLISFSESIGFLTKPEEDAHLPFVVTAHEIAHQWWGHLISPAEGPGTDLLIEGMANYAAIRLLEEAKGPKAGQEYRLFLESNYLRERRLGDQKPLLHNLAIHQTGETEAYNKGAWAMWMLHQTMGEPALQAGMHAFFKQYVGNTQSSPQLTDLLDTLSRHAPDSSKFQQSINLWFQSISLPEFEIIDASLTSVGNQWKIETKVINKGTGYVEVDLSAIGNLETNSLHSNIALKSIILPPSHLQTVSFLLDFKPTHIQFDPNVNLLQFNRQAAIWHF